MHVVVEMDSFFTLSFRSLPQFGVVLCGCGESGAVPASMKLFLRFSAVTLELALTCTEDRFLLLCPQPLS